MVVDDLRGVKKILTRGDLFERRTQRNKRSIMRHHKICETENAKRMLRSLRVVQ